MSFDDVFNNFPILETERCRLLSPSEKYATDLFAIYGDDDTMRFMQRTTAQSVKECEELLERWRTNFTERTSIRWVIELKDVPDELVGTVALHYWSDKNKSIELGADIRKEFWGKGISTEATRAVIVFAFEKMDINRLELRCDPRNTGSTVIAKKFGFTYEGTLRQYVFVEGKGFLDESVYSLLREDFIMSQYNKLNGR